MSRKEVGIWFKGYDDASRVMDKIGLSSRGLGRELASLAAGYIGVRAITSGLGSAAKEAMSFETTMAKVSTMLEGNQPVRMREYARGVEDLAIKYGEGTQTLGKGLYDILSASVSADKAMSVLEVSVKGAKAGLTSTAVAADYVTTVLNSYGKAASEAAKVQDQGFTIVKRGKLEYAELAAEIGKVASVASTANVSYDELGAGISTLTRAGLKADIAVTALRGIISSFISPSKEASAAAAEIGLRLDATTLASIGLVGVLDKLKNANAQQLAQIVPESRAFSGLSAAVRNATGYMDDYRAMSRSTGATQEAFNKIAETTEFRLDRIGQRWVQVKKTLGSPIAETAVSILENFATGLERIGAAYDVIALNQSKVDIQRHQKKLRESLQTVDTSDPTDPFGQAVRRQYGSGIDWAEVRSQSDLTFARIMQERQVEWSREYSALDWINSALESPGTILGGADDFLSAAENRLKISRDKAEKEKQYAADRASAYRSMASDLDQRSEESFTLRRQLLDQELAEYQKFIDDKVVLDAWYNEQREKLTIEQGKASQSFYAGFRAEIMEMQRELTTLGELGAGAATDIRDGFRTAFRDASAGALNLKKILTSMGTSFANRASDYAADQVFSGIFAIGRGMGNAAAPKITAATPGAGGFHGFHRGGVPLYDRPAFTRLADLSIFDDAPRAHTGLGPGERPVIIKDEEGVFTPGQMRAMGGGSARVEALLGRMLDKLDAMERRPGVVVDYRNHLTAADVPAIVTDNRRRGGELSEF